MLMGMPRAATTFLYHHFDAHPDIFVPFRRKTNFFSLHFDSQSTDWFFNHFAGATSNQVCIDTDTIGFVDKSIDILSRIERVLVEGSKFIVCVREPGEWAYSLYKQILTFDANFIEFEPFIRGQYQLVEDGIAVYFNYQNGDIETRIRQLMTLFGDRLLLLDYKEIQRDPNCVLIKIEKFLGISHYYGQNPVSSTRINASDKRNIPLISYLLRNKHLIQCLSYLPSGLVKTIRKFYDTKVTSNSGCTDLKPPAKEVLLAREVFRDDVEFYHQLFINNGSSEL